MIFIINNHYCIIFRSKEFLEYSFLDFVLFDFHGGVRILFLIIIFMAKKIVCIYIYICIAIATKG